MDLGIYDFMRITALSLVPYKDLCIYSDIFGSPLRFVSKEIERESRNSYFNPPSQRPSLSGHVFRRPLLTRRIFDR